MKTKVKLNVSTSDGKNQPGAVVELDEAEARSLMRMGFATDPKATSKKAATTDEKKEGS